MFLLKSGSLWKPTEFNLGCWFVQDLTHNTVVMSKRHILRVDLTHSAEQCFVVTFFILGMPDVLSVQLRLCSVKSGLIPIFAPCFIRGCSSSMNILPCRLVVLSGHVVSALLVQIVLPAYREIRS